MKQDEKGHAAHGADEPDTSNAAPPLSKVFGALAAGWKDVLTGKSIGADLLSGITVAAVALPLNLALAVASGVPPAAGIVAGVVGGAAAAAFGGSALQVSGPAAALSTLVLAIAVKFGPVGVAAAAVVCGIVLLTLGLFRAGRFAKYVPHSVLAGFTTGVGLKLLDQQIPKVLGITVHPGEPGAGFSLEDKAAEIAAMMHSPQWLHRVSWLAVVCGLFVAFFIITTRHIKRFPGAIIAMALVTFVSVYLSWEMPRVGAVPNRMPDPSLPLLADDQWLDLFTMAVPLGMLVGVESLLSGRAVDAMSKEHRRLEPNLELIGQGVANTLSGFFGGMTVSGVIVRSSVNVQSGGRTRLAAITHSAALLGAVLLASEQIARIPIPALAGLLCVTGVRLIELGEFRHLLKDDKIEALAFAAAAAGTLTGHLLTGLLVGFALSAVAHFVRKAASKKVHAPAITVSRTKAEQARGVRAVLDAERAGARKRKASELPAHHAWLTNIVHEPVVAASAYVHEAATVIGHVVLSDHVHVAAGASIRADEGSPFFLGPNTNVQDGVVLHALKTKWIRVGDEEWAIYVGRNVSMAHSSLVHGPSYIGDDTFIGFKSIVHDSVVGSNCFIGHSALVVGVEIPDGRFVPHGSIVKTQDDVDKLPLVAHAQLEFNEDVVDVNRGLAAAYHSVEARVHEAASRARGAVGSSLNEPVWEAAWTRPRSEDLAGRL